MNPPYTTLVPELRDDPLGLGYAGMTDAERLASLAAKTRTRPRYLPIGEFSQWLTVSGVRFKLRAAERAEATPAQVVDYIDVVFGLERNPHITVIDPAAAAGVTDALVAAGVVDGADRAALGALLVGACSRLDELGITEPLGAGHMASARALIGG